MSNHCLSRRRCCPRHCEHDEPNPGLLLGAGVNVRRAMVDVLRFAKICRQDSVPLVKEIDCICIVGAGTPIQPSGHPRPNRIISPLGTNPPCIAIGISILRCRQWYRWLASINCLVLFMQEMPCALVFALAKAGRSNAARMAMMAITTSSSIRVKPDLAEQPAVALVLRAAQACKLSSCS